MDFFNSKKTKEEKTDVVKVPSEEVASAIKNNKYVQTDSVDKVFVKYDVLNDLSNKALEKDDRDKLHRAQLTFINSIVSPTDKDTMLDLIGHALPYTKRDLTSNLMKMATDAGMKKLKSVTRTAKILTLGKASNTINQLEDAAREAVTTNAEAIVLAWCKKLKVLFDDADKLAGGFFTGDHAFKLKLKGLKRQLPKS